MTDKKLNAHGCMCTGGLVGISQPQNFGGYATGGFTGKPEEGPVVYPRIIQPSYDVPLELYKQIEARSRRFLRKPRYWYTRKIDHGTMIVCRLGGEHDTDALELAHTLGADQLREHYDSRWLILNAIEGLERNAARLPVSTVTVHYDGCTSYEDAKRIAAAQLPKAKGCGSMLEGKGWWCYCGETDMGQTEPALCTECGGEHKREALTSDPMAAAEKVAHGVLAETIGNVIHSAAEKLIRSASFVGHVFVLTGEFNHGSRDEMRKLIMGRGGVVAGSVNRSTNWLVTGRGLPLDSVKVRKAEEIGVPVIYESELLWMLGITKED